MEYVQWSLVLTALVLSTAGAAAAQEPADACRILHGLAHHFCMDFCVDRDCDGVSPEACDSLREKFRKHTGLSVFPCESGPPVAGTPTVTPATTGTATPGRIDRGKVWCHDLNGIAHHLCMEVCVDRTCDFVAPEWCAVLHDNFFARTGMSDFPCERGTPPPTAVFTATATPPSATTTATATLAVPTGTAASTLLRASCSLDCDGDGSVSVADVIRATQIGLGAQSIAACPHLGGRTSPLTIADLVSAIRDTLNGCQ